MTTLIRRVVTVVAGLVLLGLVAQWLFTRDAGPVRFRMEVEQRGPDGNQSRWVLRVGRDETAELDGAPAYGAEAVARLRAAPGAFQITVREAGRQAWTASRDAAGRVRVDGNVATMEAVLRRVSRDIFPRRTHAVTIQEVLEANIPMPTRSRVSFPKFSYRDAFPNAKDEAEIAIPSFDEAPMLRYMRSAGRPSPAIPHSLRALWEASVRWVQNVAQVLARGGTDDVERWGAWRKFYEANLPPVEDRLPRNPAVVVGPDSPGQYGGMWRRCTAGRFDFNTKLCTESFMKNDPSGNLQPCLAYKWEASPDNRVYTMYLRKGHKWSDGRPFTSEDIAWACNVNVGSAGFDPPDWMQARDGAALLYEDDVSDWPALARRIVQEAEALPPLSQVVRWVWSLEWTRGGERAFNVGQKIRSLGPPRLWRNLQALAAGDANAVEAPALAAADLNDLFRDRRFYSPLAFDGADTGAELRELSAVGASRLDGNALNRMLLMLERNEATRLAARGEPNALTAMDVSRMNLLLFRSVYRDGNLVAPAAKDRVKVEAVPDESGDDSHIVRFTFRKPNSIFFEHMPTFMFYRMLATCKHFKAPLHPAGRLDLADTDILDWEGLFKAILSQAKAAGASAGKQVWAGLGEALRKRIETEPPRKDSNPAYKEEILDGLNRVLARREFYDPNAWKGLDVEALRQRVRRNEEENRRMDLVETFRDRPLMEEYGDLLVLEDRLARVAREGAGSLSDEETLRMNVALFRAAYSADAKKPLVARTRTEGLNLAAQEHPLKYRGWRNRFDDTGNYHPEHNPHAPVLYAWRIVSKKDDPFMLAVRNPYYYKVDANGRQLPYIDAVRTEISTQPQIRVLKMVSGNIDMQSREITLDEFNELKQSEWDGDYEVRLWANDYCGQVTFMPLQSHKDPMFAKLEEDPNFRYALSLALNRQEIIDVVFMGLGKPAQFAIPEGSPYYSESMARQCVEYDPNRANRLLDAMGLGKRAADGTRLFWNGQALIMDVNMPTTEISQAAVRLACQYWQAIGINAQMKPRMGQMMYRLEEMGTSDLRVHKEGGNYFGPFPPGSYYPSHQAESVQWYQWAAYMRSGGRSGWPAPERIKELERMWQKMVEAPSQDVKMAAWKVITDRFAADLPIIGVMTSPGQIIYVKNDFKNVPKTALAGWIAHEPGNACPEAFYFDRNYKKP